VIFQRSNARFSYPVELTANFFIGGQPADPQVIERIEIWRGGDGLEGGGTLVDTVDGIHAIQDGVGRYRILWDPYLEGSSPLTSPGVQGPGSPDQGVSPNDPTKIVPQCQYFDIWVYKNTTGGPEIHSVGLNFYLYPDLAFVDADTSKWRFEMKPDRKRLVKGENIDIRLGIIPIPLYRARRDPIVDYLLPICEMRVKVVTANNDQVLDWTAIRFTGKEGIMPTNLISGLPLGEYHLIVDFTLPNGQSIRYPRYPVQLVD
jgi:hypothetical protein